MNYDVGVFTRRRIISPAESYFAVPPVVVGGAYAGPGDIVSGATAWWGTRAYTLASIGANAIELRRDGGSPATQTFTTISGGGLDVAAITTFKGADNLFVRTLYDQTGNSQHLVQTTNASQPGFVLTGNGLTVPNMSFAVAAPVVTMTATYGQPNLPPPYTIGAVARHTASAAQQALIFDGANSVGIVYRNTADNQVGGYAGTVVQNVTIADGTWAAVQAVSTNSTSDVIAANASQTTGTNTGSNAINLANDITLGSISAAQPLDGFVTEVGIWGSAFSGTQLTNMYNNQKAYYGLP